MLNLYNVLFLKLIWYTYTVWNMSKYGVFSGPNAGKYGPEKTPYMDTFHEMIVIVS